MSSRMGRKATSKGKKVGKKQDHQNEKENCFKLELLINSLEDQFRGEINKRKSSLLSDIKTITGEHQLVINQQIPQELGDMLMSEILQLAMKQEEEENKLKDMDGEKRNEYSSRSLALSRMRSNSDSAIKAIRPRNTLKASGMKKAESVKSLTGRKMSKQESMTEIIYTPLAGKKKITAVTPKVDVNKPLPRSSLRKPYPGELLLSLSGSPIYLPSMLGTKREGPSSATSTLQKAQKMLKDKLAK